MSEGQAGVISLERAFLMAGAKASVWNVADRSTSKLMEAFYRRLAEGETKATALTRAKREFVESPSSASPYYWAGFLFVGEASTPIRPTQN